MQDHICEENGLKFNSGFNREPVMRSQHLRNTISVSSRLTNVINALHMRSRSTLRASHKLSKKTQK